MVNEGGIVNNTDITGYSSLHLYGTANKTNLTRSSNGFSARFYIYDKAIANNTTLTGLMVVEKGGIANDTILNDEYASLSVSGTANDTIVNGGKLYLSLDATANDTIVEAGGKLVAYEESLLNGLIAKAESILNIDSNAKLTGNIVIDKLADTSESSFDFAKIFTEADSLTVAGGVNDVFMDKLINEDTSKNKTLILEGGKYFIANIVKDDTIQVVGWDEINVKAPESGSETIVKLESDIELVGSNKNMNIGEGAVLDVSGHSPLEITIDGNVNNQGTMDFSINDQNSLYGFI